VDTTLPGNSSPQATPAGSLTRRIGEDIHANGTEHQIRFAYDGNQIVLQFEKDGSGAVTGAGLTHRYLWQPNAVDQLMADERTHLDSGSIVSDEVLWALTDRQGSVSDLAKRDTITGVTSVVDHIVRNSFGKVISESDPSQGSLIGWTGRPVDKATGQQNNLNRWYDPIIAGWMTQDPKGFAAGQTDLYVYCGNSPTNATDPTGEADERHHPYPLYLGGAMKQDLILLSQAEHDAVHKWLTSRGWGWSAASRAAWAKLTLAEQKAVIGESLRAAGVSKGLIESVLAKCAIGARPGIKTRRSGRLGKVLGIGGFLIALGLAEDAEAREDLVIETFHPVNILCGGCTTMGDAEWHPPPPIPRGPEPPRPQMDTLPKGRIRFGWFY
jgi:RHS repeat-associated protein